VRAFRRTGGTRGLGRGQVVEGRDGGRGGGRGRRGREESKSTATTTSTSESTGTNTTEDLQSIDEVQQSTDAGGDRGRRRFRAASDGAGEAERGREVSS
jgi:hypothetical protein